VRTFWDQEDDDEEYTDSEEEAEAGQKNDKKRIPENHVKVSFMDGSAPKVVSESLLQLVDRAVGHGDIVKMKNDVPNVSNSGTVIKSRVVADIEHVMSGTILRGIDTKRLQYAYGLEMVCQLLFIMWPFHR
jgi:hypothetical protein